MQRIAPTPQDIDRQAEELREAINNTIADFLNRDRPEIVSMTAMVVCASTALADMVVTISPPGPTRTDLSMWVIEQLGGTLMIGAAVPNDPNAVVLIREPKPGELKN